MTRMTTILIFVAIGLNLANVLSYGLGLIPTGGDVFIRSFHEMTTLLAAWIALKINLEQP